MIQLRMATIATMMNTTIQLSGILNFFFCTGGAVSGCLVWIFSFSITKIPPIDFY